MHSHCSGPHTPLGQAPALSAAEGARAWAALGARTSPLRGLSGANDMLVNVPEMGDSITEGTILEWVKGPGDYVEMDDVVVVIETDKVEVMMGEAASPA